MSIRKTKKRKNKRTGGGGTVSRKRDNLIEYKDGLNLKVLEIKEKNRSKTGESDDQFILSNFTKEEIESRLKLLSGFYNNLNENSMSLNELYIDELDKLNSHNKDIELKIAKQIEEQTKRMTEEIQSKNENLKKLEDFAYKKIESESIRTLNNISNANKTITERENAVNTKIEGIRKMLNEKLSDENMNARLQKIVTSNTEAYLKVLDDEKFKQLESAQTLIKEIKENAATNQLNMIHINTDMIKESNQQNLKDYEEILNKVDSKIVENTKLIISNYDFIMQDMVKMGKNNSETRNLVVKVLNKLNASPLRSTTRNSSPLRSNINLVRSYNSRRSNKSSGGLNKLKKRSHTKRKMVHSS